MATRYYPAVKVPNAITHDIMKGAWGYHSLFGLSLHPVNYTYRLAQSKVDAGSHTLHTGHCNQQGNYDFLLLRFCTPPQTAQSISGTFQLCHAFLIRWITSLTITFDSVARIKVHVYIGTGQTPVPRHVLLDNFVDATNLAPLFGSYAFRSLTSPATLTTGSTEAGDVVWVEFGVRIVSSPTPTPTYPPSDMTRIEWKGTGANAATGDATAGSGDLTLNSWFEFSQTLVEQAAPAPPANDTCATAIVIPTTLPSTGDFIDTTAATGTQREVWYQWTAPATVPGQVCFHALGSNYQQALTVWTGDCASLASVVVLTSGALHPHRSLAHVMWTPTPGTTYHLRVRNASSTANAPNSGGLCRLSAFWRDSVPQTDDLYVPAGLVCAFRDGVLVNFTGAFTGFAASGVVIDRSGLPMDDLNGGTHTGERLILGIHDFNLVEVIDLPTLSYGSFQSEIDFISDSVVLPGPTVWHPAQLALRANGQLLVGAYGNGYRYVAGIGTLPAYLDSVSDDDDWDAIKVIVPTQGDNQAGAPWPAAAQFNPPPQFTSPWAIAVDDAAGVLYYTAASYYTPFDHAGNVIGGTVIKRWNLTAGTAMADFATLSLHASVNPGVKGLTLLPGGGLLVCNSPYVERLNAAGTVVQTYISGDALDLITLVDLKLTADGQHFWVMDAPSTRLFKYNLASGVLELTVQPYLATGQLTQLAIYNAGDVEPPEEPRAACPATTFLTPVTPPPACPVDLVP